MSARTTRTTLSLAAATMLLATLFAPAHAGDPESALVVDTTMIEPLAEEGRVATSLGYGAEIRIMPNRELITGSIGGYYALGQADGGKTMRDIFDFHFNIGIKRERSKGKGLIPFMTFGLDVIHMTTRVVDGDTHRGVTLGINAQAGVLGYLSKRWVYRASATYLGAIVPGTGDDLGGLVLQAGIGRMFGK